MDAEVRANSESVGVEMALVERKWIQETFLDDPSPLVEETGKEEDDKAAPKQAVPAGRLAEKMKGLKLGTSTADLAPRPNSKSTCCMPALV